MITFQELIEDGDAVRQVDGTWIVYCDGANRVGKVYDCQGDTSYEAMEDAWEYILNLRSLFKQGE